jgi:hypothetical protein
VIETDPASEVATVGIEPATIDTTAGPWRHLELSARSGDLGNMPVNVAVEGDEGDTVVVGDLAERVTAAEGRLERLALGMPGGSVARRHGGPGYRLRLRLD